LLIGQKGAGGRHGKTTEKSPPAAMWSSRMDMARILAHKRRWLVALNQLFHDAVPHSIAQILFCGRSRIAHLNKG